MCYVLEKGTDGKSRLIGWTHDPQLDEADLSAAASGPSIYRADGDPVVVFDSNLKLMRATVGSRRRLTPG